MFANVLSLESRKQRYIVLNACLFLGIALPGTFLVTLLRREDPIDTLTAITEVSILCIPVFGLFLGVLAARGLREMHRRSAEEALPFSPAERVFGAYAVSTLMFVLLSVLLLLLRSMFGMPSTLQDFTAEVLPGIIAVILGIHLLGFTCTYLLRNAGPGMSLACLIVGASFFGCTTLAGLRGWRILYPMDLDTLLVKFVLFAFLCLVLGWIALYLLSTRVEREKPMRFLLVPVLLFLLAAPLLCAMGIARDVSFLENRLFPHWSWFWSMQRAVDTIEAPIGYYFQTQSNTIIRILPDGTRYVVYEAPSLDPFLQPPTQVDIKATFPEANGGFWILMIPDVRNSWSTYEILHSEPGKIAATHTTFQSRDVVAEAFLDLGGVLYICGRGDDQNYYSSHYYYSVVPAKGKLPVWKPMQTSGRQPLLSAATELRLALSAREGRAASFSQDRKTLTWKSGDSEIAWNLPGTAISGAFNIHNFAPVVFYRDGKPGFTVAVSQQDGSQRVYACEPDGSIHAPWDRSWKGDQIRLKSALNGYAWYFGHWMRTEYVLPIGKDGKYYPEISVADLFRDSGIEMPQDKQKPIHIYVARIEGDRMWLTLQWNLLEYDLKNRKVLKNMEHPAEGWPTKEGFYYISDNRIGRIDWNFQKHDLGPAKR